MRRTRDSLVAQLLEQDADDAAAGGIERRGRLVEDEDARRADERLRDPKPLLHPLGHAVHAPVARVGERDALEQPLPLGGTGIGAGEPLVKDEYLVRRVPARKAEQLGEVAELCTRGAGARTRACDLRPPARRVHETDSNLDEGRLSRAVRAEEADELALLHGEVDAVERLNLSVALLECVDGERVRHASRVRHYAPPLPRGYVEGPAAEEAERRAEAAARYNEDSPAPPDRQHAVLGCTENDPQPHFSAGWARWTPTRCSRRVLPGTLPS